MSLKFPVRFAVILPCAVIAAGCFDSPGNDSISGAPTCYTKEAWVTGTLDHHDEEHHATVSSYSLSQSPVGSSVDFAIEDKGHVHLEWDSTGAEGHQVTIAKGTYTSPTTGATYCVGDVSKLVLTKTGGQFELNGLKLGECPGTKSVDGTVDACFDGG